MASDQRHEAQLITGSAVVPLVRATRMRGGGRGSGGTLRAVSRRHHVLLVPGFFGFANLGDFAYFTHVQELLAEIGPGLGLDGEVRVVLTEPTASLPRRAALLAESLSSLLDEGPGEVSIVGHSSGGLDARLVMTPGVTLPTAVDVERCARRVGSVVTVSTPHLGTPVAHLFNNLLGQQLLRILSLATIYTLRTGRLPISVALRLARILRRPGSRPSGVLDQLFLELLADFSGSRRRAVEGFLADVRSDQGLVGQITPAGMDLFNASTLDRPGVRYGCVVTRARPPGFRSFFTAGLDAYAQATHALFVVLYRFASTTHGDRRPRVTAEHAAVLRRAYGRIPDLRANDGIVPTLSQLRGDPIAAVWADHHDVIGHFHLPKHVPPHFDWVASGTGFDRRQFEAVWRDIAAYLVGVRRPLGVALGPAA
jgi:triacylglycerol lipase